MSNAENAPEADEITQLRDRVAELEAELKGKGKTKTSDEKELADLLRNTSSRAVDNSTKLIRGITLAYLEQLRLAANVVNTLASDVVQMPGAKEKMSGEDLIKLPKNIYARYLSAINESLDIPSKTIEKFYEGYKKDEKSKGEKS